MTKQQQIEILFNSVEVELNRRWAFGNVPQVFAKRSPSHLRRIVEAWWHLYHESRCAQEQCDRQVWERNPAYPAEALSTPMLVASLMDVKDLLNTDELRTYRELTRAEEAGIGLLCLLTIYYSNPQCE